MTEGFGILQTSWRIALVQSFEDRILSKSERVLVGNGHHSGSRAESRACPTAATLGRALSTGSARALLSGNEILDDRAAELTELLEASGVVETQLVVIES